MASSTIEIESPLIAHIPPGVLKEAIDKRATTITKESHLGGIFYWLLFGICLFKDALDLVWTALMAIGLGISATGLGAVVGIPLLVFAKLLGLASGVMVSLLIITYLFASDSTTGVSIAGKVIGRRLLIPLVIIIMDSMVPGVEALPITTICFAVTVWLENRIRKGGALGAATALVVKELSSKKMTFRQKFVE